MHYAGGVLIENSLISAFFDDVAILIFFTVRVNTYCEHLGNHKESTRESQGEHKGITRESPLKRFVEIIVANSETIPYHSKRHRELRDIILNIPPQ